MLVTVIAAGPWQPHRWAGVTKVIKGPPQPIIPCHLGWTPGNLLALFFNNFSISYNLKSQLLGIKGILKIVTVLNAKISKEKERRWEFRVQENSQGFFWNRPREIQATFINWHLCQFICMNILNVLCFLGGLWTIPVLFNLPPRKRQIKQWWSGGGFSFHGNYAVNVLTSGQILHRHFSQTDLGP